MPDLLATSVRFCPPTRLRPRGTFGNGGTVRIDFLGAEDDAFSVLIQPDGKIVAVGSASPVDFYDFAAARYLSNGTLDTTFGTGGRMRVDFGNQDMDIASDAALQPMERSSPGTDRRRPSFQQMITFICGARTLVNLTILLLIPPCG